MNPVQKPFKMCPCCFFVWPTRTDFLKDPSLLLNGYKADFEALEFGLFFFTHQAAECQSTLALEVNDFMDLYQGTRHTGRRTGMSDCPGYCVDKEQLQRCDALCECAFVREILHLVKQHGQPVINTPVR